MDKLLTSPKRYARIAGLLYAISIAAGIFAELGVRERLVMANDVAATARNILAHEQLFRWGFAAELVACLCNVPLGLIFYELFKVVNRRVTLMVVFFTLVGTAVEGMEMLGHLAPLVYLKKGIELGADPHLMQVQAYLALSLQSIGFDIALTFFGGYCLCMGWLVFRSGFMPRFIGVLLWVEGAGYLVNSFTHFLAPQYSGVVFPFLLATAVAEFSLCLWLLIMGVNVPRWRERAALAAT
ncbi:MAG TPA: DUF4386 domain-containing protein [Gammaproteobacteria bacterium]|jgi:hypothetical protein|nr:DUF4386 domain-containing protein [Gammaproteobacteria bacterium]